MINKKIVELSDLISSESNRSEFHPIDRHFLQSYIDEILTLDKDDFLFYNLEHKSNLYSNYLMLCLPELWHDMDADHLIKMINRFTNIFSFYGLVTFTYTYIEVNIIKLILDSPTIKINFKRELISFLKNQYINLFKTESNIFFIEKGLIGINNNEWMYIKQKLILDKRIEPSLDSPEELRIYINKLGDVSN
jgi:hypothetical protein